ncbi:DUF6691 family protein [Agrobacterium sp. rho-8.1]|nr:YeeE/YedE family protein [Agrobacterium sp. rho-8.1]
MTRAISQFAAALGSGVVFGFGLSLSGMLNPVRVQGFLDIFGLWDASLAFVLGGAVLITFVGMQIIKGMPHPVLHDTFDLPKNRRVDAPLVGGSILFGLGWGLGGFCPGPAIASLSLGLPQTALFVIAMLVGMTLHDTLWRKRI